MEKSLFAVRTRSCPPHYVSETFLGTNVERTDKTIKMDVVCKAVEIMSQTQQGFAVNLNIGEEIVLKSPTFVVGDISSFEQVTEDTHPGLFKLISEYENMKRAQAAGIVMPGPTQQAPRGPLKQV